MKRLLFAFAIVFSFACSANHPLYLYSIDASTRGKDLFTSISAAFSLATTSGEVVIQTVATPPYIRAPGLMNGVIPYVQQTNLFAAPNSTLFIIPYNPKGDRGITQNTQYLVVTVEQIVTVAYRNTISPPFPLTGFSSTYAASVYPLYTISPSQRAADLQWAANLFITSPTSFNGNSGSQVWIQTTLMGPFYVPFNNSFPGLIPNVTAISVLANEFLLITYKPNSSSFAWSVEVPAEQVQQIVFYPTNVPNS